MAGTNFPCDPSGWPVDALDGQTLCLEAGFITGDACWLDDSSWFEDFNLAASHSSDVDGSRELLESDATRGKTPANLVQTTPMDCSSHSHQLYDVAAHR